MASKPIAVALFATVVALPAAAQSIRVEVYNNTAVDLCVDGKSQQDCVEVQPTQTRRVAMRPRHWINFGMESHEYRLPKKLVDAYSKADSPPLKLQAESDGRLYLVPRNISFPARPLPRQPSGFPLVPKRVVDLT